MKRQMWADLSTFAAIADAGSFSAAAGRLGVSPSALSHAMRAMEERLGVRLLNRSTRSVAPTEAGERLLVKLRPAMANLSEAVDRLQEDQARPAGRVRISAHRTGATLAIVPRLAAFGRAFPDVQVEVSVDDGLVDIVAQGFDAGVRHGHVLDQDMISVRISDPLQIVYAATPEYWRGAGRPAEPRDLLAHRCVRYRLTTSGGLLRWQFARGEERLALDPPAALISNDVEVVRDAALSGTGVACLLQPQAANAFADGLLEPVLREWSPTVEPNYLYFPSRRQLSPAVRAFVDAMKSVPDESTA